MDSQSIIRSWFICQADKTVRWDIKTSCCYFECVDETGIWEYENYVLTFSISSSSHGFDQFYVD